MSLNWAESGTCWVAMLLRTVWIAFSCVAAVAPLGAVKMHTLGPNWADAYTPHNEDGGGAAAAVAAGTIETAVAAISAAAVNMDGRRNNRRPQLASDIIVSSLVLLAWAVVPAPGTGGFKGHGTPPRRHAMTLDPLVSKVQT